MRDSTLSRAGPAILDDRTLSNQGSTRRRPRHRVPRASSSSAAPPFQGDSNGPSRANRAKNPLYQENTPAKRLRMHLPMPVERKEVLALRGIGGQANAGGRVRGHDHVPTVFRPWQGRASSRPFTRAKATGSERGNRRRDRHREAVGSGVAVGDPSFGVVMIEPGPPAARVACGTVVLASSWWRSRTVPRRRNPTR